MFGTNIRKNVQRKKENPRNSSAFSKTPRIKETYSKTLVSRLWGLFLRTGPLTANLASTYPWRSCHAKMAKLCARMPRGSLKTIAFCLCFANPGGHATRRKWALADHVNSLKSCSFAYVSLIWSWPTFAQNGAAQNGSDSYTDFMQLGAHWSRGIFQTIGFCLWFVILGGQTAHRN